MGPQLMQESAAMSNGVHHEVPEFLGSKRMINRQEYIRLMEQSLHRLGFSAAAQQLERDSGIQMQPVTVTQFQDHIFNGRWDAALALLPRLTYDPTVALQARFLIIQQKYVEAVEAGHMSLALRTLRKELTPLKINEPQLRKLAGCLLRQHDDPVNPLIKDLEWGVLEECSRAQLIWALQQRLPPSIMIPDNRLEQLVEQALDAQVAKCPYHNTQHFQISLFSDYQAGIEQLPTHPNQVLETHRDEVWHVQFSNSGLLLASASKDATAQIWRIGPTGEAVHMHTLTGHDKAVAFLTWSPDDSRLLTCGSDHEVRLWNTDTGHCAQVYKHQQNQVSSCAWQPDSKRFVVGTADRIMYTYDVEGQLLRRVKLLRINDLALTRDGTVMVTVNQEKIIKVQRVSDNREAREMAVSVSESVAIMSMALSPDNAWILVNLSSHTIHLWPMEPMLRQLDALHSGQISPDEAVQCMTEPAMEYKMDPNRQPRFIIRSCFGGSNASFVASGSEDCRVHIWHRESGDLLAQLEGHSGTVNSVSWNPTNPFMLASASDDKTVRIWMAPLALNHRPAS
ncbi:WD40 repeat-like protein [Coccomyxa subellipsoidea C-169]|uniref:WD40 repeat-like protein n=1 Tax=Coccomyxa subellipsoidea (strain C-169) TaxID=574566 RepID=I0YUA0_COCSC|nr:WD40 repeat-like protein [Coccomyxa subellipsoidea C-169]EIE21969.1 WD40 repeat-like protein [Coccomyxa subellipsoidea C-169]|eukprot:XP_005646513.1 WD40 repeat-like protein [Coccomyxa subellipsoidea C-169]